MTEYTKKLGTDLSSDGQCSEFTAKSVYRLKNDAIPV